MTNKSNLLALSFALALLSACSTTPNQAPVVDRSPPPPVKPATPSETAQIARDERGLYTVKKGDTLIRIALEYGQNYRDLVTWNNLSNPNDIKVDQVLRVLPPDSASNGVQTGAIVMPPAEKTPPPPPVVKKTEPKGEKKPYSESALAELQRADGNGNGKAEASVKPAPAPSPAVTTAPPAAAAVAASAEDEKLSWMWPSEGRVVATFDEGKNKGVDIAGKAGQQVVAAGAGKVMYAGSGIRGYGNLVIVKHSNSLLSAYAHNRTIVVKEGQSVNKGQMIAEMGDSDADSVKLHFEIRQQGKPVDPSRFLPNR
ncbi:LysM peptidoglycan-binding domain-containing protein [Duganella sp. BJB488]|uniref:peptidoglycan DD-metalloendopeptidase family protein n=1 Tax=unclassified Duganella TaxID=2636909 RepID=UPI000E347F10|nr:MULTISPECIES: peptidoglycan DD-metalloendopeptidase family protein [unclassified Duganella]NVD71229.1 peptidoglycan DD-metalloendopeptidase family protein [Duganella sp. BJB1802]RFP09013.1 LysM peptidoglycan-binding domain-containing protein [Duganella sp. BJB489]RFP11804.1 LysM peptidoglycan-binding domain-containing protein [Duganella sp. BJB488]RFP29067.1 LysM peptidoglycan-binding domain-containing protein [Duganella sp. BJB480]